MSAITKIGPARIASPVTRPGDEIAALKLASAIIGRWRQGEPPDAGAVLAQNRELQAHSMIVFDLAYQEYHFRRLQGETPDIEEYCRRFPSVADSLREMLRIHEFAEACPEAQAELLAPSWPESGETFLDFSLILELGRGAFGRVFLASEPILGGRLVALKVGLHGASEAHTLGRLRHPNIVPVYSVREDPETGMTALCMPYLGTTTLEDILDRAVRGPRLPDRAEAIVEAVRAGDLPAEAGGKFPSPPRVLRRGSYVDGVLHLAAQLADALQFVHSVGISHRDLKPSNVLVSPDGRPMLLDFNLSHDEQRAVNQLGGTLPYMSPEQLLATDRGQLGKNTLLLDPRTDLFSLGVILYSLLTGKHPFGPFADETNDQRLRLLLLERQRGGAAPVRTLNFEIEPPLARLVDRCLAYNPNDRPQAAAELAAGLRKGLSLPRRMRRWARRRPLAALLSAAAALALTFTGIVGVATRAPYSERQFNKGIEAYRQGNYSQAVNDLNRGLDSDPNSTMALFLRGRAYLHLGEQDEKQWNQAMKDFQDLDAIHPEGRIQACMGYCQDRQRQPIGARLYYQQALRSGFRNAALLNNLGYLYLREGGLEEALQCLADAVACDPKLQLAHWNRALAFKESALRLRTSLVQRGARNSRTGNGPELALQAEFRHAIDSGREAVRRALELGPASLDLHLTAAELCALAAERDSRCIQPALDHLESAVNAGLDPRELQLSPIFLPLRGERKFKSLLMRDVAPIRPAVARNVLDPVDDQLP